MEREFLLAEHDAVNIAEEAEEKSCEISAHLKKTVPRKNGRRRRVEHVRNELLLDQ
jgi:hypothetical protein